MSEEKRSEETEEGILDFQKLVDDSLGGRGPPKKKDRDSIDVSSLSSCARANWYKYFIPRAYPKKTLRIFKMGDLIHDWITGLLRRSEEIRWVDSEQSVSIVLPDEGEWIRLAGRFDDYVTTKGGKRYIVEKKSTKSVKNLRQPYPAHLRQIMIYLKARGLSEGTIPYFSKEDMEVKQYNVKFDQNIFEGAVERGKQILRYVRHKVLPPPEAIMDNNSSFMCKGCIYKNECWKNSPVEIEDNEENHISDRSVYHRAKRFTDGKEEFPDPLHNTTPENKKVYRPEDADDIEPTVKVLKLKKEE